MLIYAPICTNDSEATMSEQLLQGLMQLFAIIAKLEGDNIEERKVVSLFLSNQLNIEDAEKYLAFFDQYVEDHSRVRKPSKSSGPSPRLTVRDSSKMLVICDNINKELTQQQKVMVLFTLFSLIRADEEISPIEYEFLTTVADIFNISIKEFKLLETFAWSRQLHDADMEDILFVSANPFRKYKISRHIFEENLEGEITVMRIAAIGMYLIRFDGTGTYYLNGVQMLSEEIYTFDTGSVIKGGKMNSLYYSDIVSKFMDSESHERISFEAKNIAYQFSNGRVGLHSLSLAEESGRLVGLMGPSGAGKSTLLEILNGNLLPSVGEVLLNGISIHQNPEAIKGVIGYVPQDDLLIEELTVYQNLYYAANLCFGDYTKEQIHKLVNLTLISLGLSDISHLKVGNPLDKTISGGERKRVNIALELLRAPSVMFVDEPTSGLSSRDSLNIMDLLKELTLSGKLVFVVIHQPSSDIFKMFDKLLIMDTGGYPIYYGNPVEAIVYFKSRINQINKEQTVCPECGNVNPEQIFDIVETKTVNQYGRFTSKRKVAPEAWNEYFREHQKPPTIKTIVEPVSANLKVANKLKQWRVFLKRDFLAKGNNAQYLIVNFAQAPLLAFLLAFVNRYYDANNGKGYSFGENENIPVYFFIGIIVALFMGLIVSAEEIYHDRRILKREAFLNLSPTSYYLSKVALLFTMSAVQTLSFVLLGDIILDIQGFTVAQWSVLFSVSCFANMVGLNISSAFSSAVTIYVMIPILLIPQLMLGGIVVKFDRINPAMSRGDKVPFLGDVMVSRWAFEAIMVSQYQYNPYMVSLFEYEKTMAQSEYKKVYLYPALLTKVEYYKSQLNRNVPDKKEYISDNALVLKRHLVQELTDADFAVPVSVERLSERNFTINMADSLVQLITQLTNYQSNNFQLAFQQRSKAIAAQTATPEASEVFLNNKRDYYNKAVADMVKNSNQTERIIEADGQLYQKLYPIYRGNTPDTPAWSVRSHFFASEKHFMGYEFPTLAFNLMIIWLMTFIAYVALYFGLLRALVRKLSFRRAPDLKMRRTLVKILTFRRKVTNSK